MLGRCIYPGSAFALELNRVYYLFDNGPNYFYVSRFNNKGAHLGCYQAEHFEIIEQPIILPDPPPQPKGRHNIWPLKDWPQEPETVINNVEPGNMYLAKLIWRREGYKQTALRQYYLKAGKTHAYFYKDPNFKICGGCYPLHWFTDFEEIHEDHGQNPQIEQQPEPEPIELFEKENGQLSFF